MKSHDLTAKAVQMARSEGIPFPEAIRRIASRGGQASARRKRTEADQRRRAEAARDRADRISP